MRAINRPVKLGGAIIRWKTEEGDVAVAPHEVPAALPPIVMPMAFASGPRVNRTVARIARAHPGPITLNDFV